MGSCMSTTKTVSEKTTNTTARVSRPVNTQPRPKSQTHTTLKPKTQKQGRKLVDDNAIAQLNEKLDPKEAARLAAEKRFNDQQNKQGALGKKLQEERAKSGQKHLKEASELKLNEKKENLAYD